MNNHGQVVSTLAQMNLLRTANTTDLGSRCAVRFENPDGAGEIEIEFDYSPSDAQIEHIGDHLPLQANERASAKALMRGQGGGKGGQGAFTLEPRGRQ